MMTNMEAAIILIEMYEQLPIGYSRTIPTREAMVKAIWALQNAPEEQQENENDA